MSKATATAPPVLGAHHIAYRCFDAEQTRQFYEDIVGLKLAAALDLSEISGTDTPLEYLHIFFEFGDGNFLAFFDVPAHMKERHFKPQSPFNRHIALELASDADLAAMHERLAAHGYKVDGPFDHGFVRSIATLDPNGLVVEFTYRTADYQNILGREKDEARRHLAAWTERTAEAKRRWLSSQRKEPGACH